MKLLLFLQIQIEQHDKEIDAVLKNLQNIAELQHSQQSEWSVNGAAFILVALFCILVLGGVFGLFVKSILNQQKQLTQKVLNSNDLVEKFHESFEKNTEVLTQVSGILEQMKLVNEEKLKQETTINQLHHLIKTTLDSSKYRIVQGVLKIIEDNNIVDKEKIQKKVNDLIKNTYNKKLLGFNSFMYKEKRIGEILQSNESDWLSSQKELVWNYIYTENRDIMKFIDNLDLFFDSMFNDLRQNLHF